MNLQVVMNLQVNEEQDPASPEAQDDVMSREVPESSNEGDGEGTDFPVEGT